MVFLALLLGVVGWWSAAVQPGRTGGLAIEGGADGEGAAVYVNRHVVGRMRQDPDSGLKCRLDVRVPLGRVNELEFVSARGERLVTRAPIGESTLIQVSFRDHRVHVLPAGAGAISAEADTSAEFDD
jgi:hypothetical protein